MASVRRDVFTLAVHAALLGGTQAFAADAAEADTYKATELGKISVDAEVSDLKVDTAQSPKYTEPLRDTPQTITVIPSQLIQQQGALLLRDVLRQNVPGITFGAGEGGSYGDSINIRGFAATNDIAVDGVRQSANTTHTDPFDMQAIEVVQGASSVYSGVGALGGTVNFVSKLPEIEDFANFTVGGGNADYLRATADVNQEIGAPERGIAVRVNAMAHKNHVAERDVTGYRRWGIAPSIAFGLGTSTSLTLSYVHEHDRNLPEYGIPLRNFAPVPGIERTTYYGFRNTDVERIDDDSVTAILAHDFSARARVRNLTRLENYERYSITDSAEGRICFAPGEYPLGTNLQAPGTTLRCGAAGASPGEGVGGPTYTLSGPVGNLRDNRNRILANQTDLTLAFETGAIHHTLVTGLSLSRERFHQRVGGEYRNPNGTTYLYTPQPLYNPSNEYQQPINLTLTTRANSSLNNQAVYAFDTLKLGERWLLGLGVRYEHNKASYESFTATPAASLTTAPGPLVAVATNPLVNDDRLLSYRAALVYKPAEETSVYAAYGISKLPSAASVNGSCGVNCNVDPQLASSFELGVKQDLLEERLALTGAIFRTERTNYLVASGDPAIPTQQLDGKARVDGVQIGIAGNVTRDWAVFANYAFLRSEVLQSVSDFTIQTTGIDAQKGNALANTPEHSANLWTTYRLMRSLTAGYGANYTSRVQATANSATPTAIYNRATIPGFVLHDAMLAHDVSRHLSVQLNVTNLFNRQYLTQLRSTSTTSGWANPGAGRTYIATALLNF